MPVVVTPAITLLIAAALGLINLWLALRVSQVRIQRKISLGIGDDPRMEARTRSHANFNEYVPIALILMLLIELRGGHPTGLWAIGARLIHPLGMDRPAPNPLRAGGAMLTWATLLALVIWAVLIGFGRG